jgi:hypothetical protein
MVALAVPLYHGLPALPNTNDGNDSDSALVPPSAQKRPTSQVKDESMPTIMRHYLDARGVTSISRHVWVWAGDGATATVYLNPHY